MSAPVPLVQKYGGSSFTDLRGFEAVAGHVTERVVAEGRPAVVVVSAMSGTTGRLRAVLDEVNVAAAPSTVATLLTTGETVSSALLVAAVEARGLRACLLTGDAVGFVACGPPDRARLQRVDPAPLTDAVGAHDVVVLPGGQAVDPDGRVVMLGRNSSDLSAVAAAAALGAPVCEIFSDTPGICTADPYLVPSAQTLPEVSYETVVAMSRAGAKVLYESAVSLAARSNVRLHCRSVLPEGSLGTVVGQGAPPVAAVVLNERGRVWGFAGERARRGALAALSADGVDAQPVDVGDALPRVAAYVVVDDAEQVHTAGPGLAAARAHPELRLLTTLHADGRTDRLLVPARRAAALVRRQHDLLYPDPGRRASGHLPSKRRAADSGILLGVDR